MRTTQAFRNSEPLIPWGHPPLHSLTQGLSIANKLPRGVVPYSALFYHCFRDSCYIFNPTSGRSVASVRLQSVSYAHHDRLLLWVCVLVWQSLFFGSGAGHRGDFCGELLETSTMCNKANL